MNVFRYNYGPGKGVPKDEIKKKGIGGAVRIYMRHILEILGLNVIYFTFSLPIMLLAGALLFFLFGDWFDVLMGVDPVIFENALSAGSDAVPDGAFLEFLALFVVIQRFIVLLLFFFTSAVAFGPLECGVTYVCRRFVRESHTYVWKDLKEHMFLNMKQGLTVSIINLFLLAIFIFSFGYYYSVYGAISGILLYIVAVFFCIIIVFFMCITMYVYPVMITYDMKITDIYMTAYIAAIQKMPRNIAVLAFLLIILMLSFQINAVIGGILMLFLYPATLKFIVLAAIDPNLERIEKSQES